MSRSRAYTRHQRQRCIQRKKNLIRDGKFWIYKYEGMLSKGKIHCSCWMCRTKSYDYPKIQDVRHRMAMDASEADLMFHEKNNTEKFFGIS